MSTTTPAADRGTERSNAGAPGGDGRPSDAGAPGPVPAETLDRRYQALSDPKRRRILALLREGERCVCELVDAMEVSQSLLSFHLKTLKEADLVDDRRDGRWVHYRTRPDALAGLQAHLSALAPGSDGAEGDPAGDAGPGSGADDGAEEPYRCC